MYLAAGKVTKFVRGLSAEEFLDNEEKQFAVLHGLEIIGEAANFVTEETKQELDLIPWHEIRGMRNRLAHEYFAVDLKMVWDTIVYALPPLIQALEQYVSPPGDNDDDPSDPITS